MPRRNISLIKCISCQFSEFISIVTPPIIRQANAKAAMFDTDVGSNSRSALALIGREAHVLVLRRREAFHRWTFPALCLAEYRLPPLENAFTHVYDNCEITLKKRNATVKIKNNAGKCFQ